MTFQGNGDVQAHQKPLHPPAGLEDDQAPALEHFSAKWIRFAVKKCGTPRKEMIPCQWKQL